MRKPNILVLESDEALCRSLKEPLRRQGYTVIDAGDHAGLLYSVRHHNLDLIIMGSGANSGWETLKVAQEIRRLHKKIRLILIMAESSEDMVLAALRAGVSDYFRKPFSCEELAASVTHCLASSLPCLPSMKAETNASSFSKSRRLIGESPAIQATRIYVLKVAATDSTLLITGETGTGKELVAELIHRNSTRSGKPFVCFNCAAFPDSLLESELFGYERGAFTGAHATQRGKFELAEGGSLFLDEIGEMSLYAQAKILRAIESKEIYRLGSGGRISLNVRIIAATNQDPERQVAEEKLRKDLYFRLNVARVHLLPLRERKEDIPILLDHCLRELNQRFELSIQGFTPEALACLLRYDWPGNVRELKNLCEAIFISAPSQWITLSDFPELYQGLMQEIEKIPQDERDRLLSALFSTNWNVSKAARKLSWSRMTVYRKIAKYHICKSGDHEEALAANAPTETL